MTPPRTRSRHQGGIAPGPVTPAPIGLAGAVSWNICAPASWCKSTNSRVRDAGECCMTGRSVPECHSQLDCRQTLSSRASPHPASSAGWLAQALLNRLSRNSKLWFLPAKTHLNGESQGLHDMPQLIEDHRRRWVVAKIRSVSRLIHPQRRVGR